MCIVGKNGVGKTILIRKILENISKSIKKFYMPQDYLETMNKYLNAIEYLKKDDSNKAYQKRNGAPFYRTIRWPESKTILF